MLGWYIVSKRREKHILFPPSDHVMSLTELQPTHQPADAVTKQKNAPFSPGYTLQRQSLQREQKNTSLLKKHNLKPNTLCNPISVTHIYAQSLPSNGINMFKVAPIY